MNAGDKRLRLGWTPTASDWHTEMAATRKGDNMTLEGTVQNGMVVLKAGCNIPEGTQVQVIVPDAKEQPTFLDLLEFAGCMPDMPADFAAQHDHYLHGTPKQ